MHANLLQDVQLLKQEAADLGHTVNVARTCRDEARHEQASLAQQQVQ